MNLFPINHHCCLLHQPLVHSSEDFYPKSFRFSFSNFKGFWTFLHFEILIIVCQPISDANMFRLLFLWEVLTPVFTTSLPLTSTRWFDQAFKAFPLTSINLRNNNNLETFLGMPRIKPGAAGWEAQALPLCCAPPPLWCQLRLSELERSGITFECSAVKSSKNPSAGVRTHDMITKFTSLNGLDAMMKPFMIIIY